MPDIISFVGAAYPYLPLTPIRVSFLQFVHWMESAVAEIKKMLDPKRPDWFELTLMQNMLKTNERYSDGSKFCCYPQSSCEIRSF